jgi:hypothetical protein
VRSGTLKARHFQLRFGAKRRHRLDCQAATEEHCWLAHYPHAAAGARGRGAKAAPVVADAQPAGSAKPEGRLTSAGRSPNSSSAVIAVSVASLVIAIPAMFGKNNIPFAFLALTGISRSACTSPTSSRCT